MSNDTSAVAVACECWSILLYHYFSKGSLKMAIPDYQSLMLPLLKTVEDGKEHKKREVLNELAKQFGLTENKHKELLPSGNQEIFDKVTREVGCNERPPTDSG